MSIWDRAEAMARLRLRMGGLRSHRAEGSHVYDAAGRGDRPTVVLLHGVGSSATAYGKLLLGLRPHVRRIVAPDLPGHGFSAPMADFGPDRLIEHTVELVDRLIDGPVVVVGTSMGGGLALRYALARPQNVRSLILCSPAGAPLSDAGKAGLTDLFDMGPADAGHAFVDRLFARRPPLRPIVARAVRDRLQRPVVRGLLGDLERARFLTPDEARRLAPPTLLLWGRAEKILPDECLAWYRRHLPSTVTIEEPEGWGHSAHLEQTGALVRRVCRFVDEVEGRDGCPKTPGEAPSE